LANAATCSSVCRFSFGRAIHSRMILLRVSWSSMFAVPWVILIWDSRARPSVTYGREKLSSFPLGNTLLPHNLTALRC
jgi:hypothetical protein